MWVFPETLTHLSPSLIAVGSFGEGLGRGNVDDCAPIYWSIIRQPEDCKSDKAIPRGEGLGGGNVDDCALIYWSITRQADDAPIYDVAKWNCQYECRFP